MADFTIGNRDDEERKEDYHDLPEDNSLDATGGVSKWGMGCGLLFIAPFAIGGIFFLITGITGMQKGEENAHIGVFVGGVFIIVSGLMLAGVLHASRRAKEIAKKQGEFPDQPWMWRPDWAEGCVKCEGKIGVWVAGGFALIWNAISWGVTISAWEEMFGPKGDKKAMFILLFPVVGLFLLAWFVYALVRHKKYGVSVFRMLSNPGVLGGTLRGAVEIPVQVSPPEGFKMRLLCVHRYSSGTGDNRRTHEDTKWEEEKVIKKDLLGHDRSRTGVPVFFNIPYNLPQSRENPTYIWKLKISADVPGVDYASEFHVPVFKTEASDANAEPVEDPTTAYQPHGGDYQWPADDPIRVTDAGETVEAYFPPARNKGVLFFLFIFALFWNGAIWFMIQEKVPILFPIVFGFFDLLILLFLFTGLFYSARIVAGPVGLRVYSRFIIPLGEKSFSSDQVKRISVSSGMQSGDKQYFDIKAELMADKKIGLASGIREKRQAEWLAKTFSQRLGKEDPK